MSCTALAEATLAPADNAVAQGRQSIEDGLPTAPEKYRRPKGWKPSAPYPKTLPVEFANSPLPFVLVCR